MTSAFRSSLGRRLCATVVVLSTVPATILAQTSLPSPQGPLHLGTTVRHLADSSRVDLISRRRPRELAVQLWYPTTDSGGARAPYVSSAVRRAMIGEGYLHLDSAVITGWAGVRTHAVLDARIIGRSLPLLLLSHGQGVSRSHYTALAEALASHGYVVAAIDHPYGGVMKRADGHVLTLAADSAAGPQDSVLVVRAEDWARDASFVVDQLYDRHTALGALAAPHLTDGAIGMLGHSLGGAAALEACRRDVRFRACADLDGMLVGRVASEGPRGPTLIVRSSPTYSDADLERRGRTRAQWEAMGREVAAHFHGVAARGAPGTVTLLRLRGAGHMTFSDAPLTFPDAITRFGGTPLEPTRAVALVNAIVTDFFDRTLRGGSRPTIAAFVTSAPEIEAESP